MNKDPAQEFADRVSDMYFYSSELTPVKLSTLIANELRDGGWRSREDWMSDMRVMTRKEPRGSAGCRYHARWKGAENPDIDDGA